MRNQVSLWIDEAEQIIHDEAVENHDTNLLDDEVLYQCFLDNRQYQMRRANWTVMKYFYAKMIVKLLREMIGEWTYTKHDRAMYNFFMSIGVFYDKCKPSFISIAKLDGLVSKIMNDTREVWLIFYKVPKYREYFEEYAFKMFTLRYRDLTTMIRHVKRLSNSDWDRKEGDFFVGSWFILYHEQLSERKKIYFEPLYYTYLSPKNYLGI